MVSADSFIHLSSITKSFGSFIAVDNIDLSIGKGEFFSLLGPSGCGKTTLLRMLGGLEMPTSGQIFVDGEDVTYQPPYRRPTNMVFQSYAIFPHLTVGENIAYGLRRGGHTRAEINTLVGRMLELIRLPQFAARKATELSGGQMQRVALARALILQPKVLLLDEPLAALDKKLREQMQVELRTIQKEVGITFVFVTHDQEEALTMSDRVAVMSSGKVLQCSRPQDLYERPLNREVAEFVGEMNFLPGSVARASGTSTWVDVAPFGNLELARQARPCTGGDAVIVAFRPEQLTISDNPGDGIPCRIPSSSYLVGRTNYVVEVPGFPVPLTVAHPNNSRHRPMNSAADHPHWLGLDPAGGIILSAG